MDETDGCLASLAGRVKSGVSSSSIVSDLIGDLGCSATVDIMGDRGYDIGGDGLRGRLGGGDLGGTLGVVSIGIALRALSRLAFRRSSSSSRAVSQRR